MIPWNTANVALDHSPLDQTFQSYNFMIKLYALSITLMVLFFVFQWKKPDWSGVRVSSSEINWVSHWWWGGDKALCYSVFMVISIILMNATKQLDRVCVPPYISLYVCLSIKSNHVTWYHFSLSIFPCELIY